MMAADEFTTLFRTCVPHLRAYARSLIRNVDAAFKLVGIRTLAELFRSGEINKIYDKWLKPIAGPPSEMLKTVWAAQAFPP